MHIVLIATVLLGGDDAGNTKKIRENIRIMTSEKADWLARCNAEDELKKYTGKSAFEPLLPHIAKGMPPGAIWNSGGRELDKRASVKWQIFYAVHRTWDDQLKSLKQSERPGLLFELLPKAKTPHARRQIVDDMANNWTPDAETLLANILRDKKLDFGSRRDAGFVLMLHQGKKYHETFRKVASEGSRSERKQWFDILVDPRHKRQVGIDPRVTDLGFELLVEEKKANPKYIHGAYFIACYLETYVGKKFRPDQNMRKYQAKNGGLNELFFRDTVDNALRWWASNRKS